jgi:hypothetical protein
MLGCSMGIVYVYGRVMVKIRQFVTIVTCRDFIPEYAVASLYSADDPTSSFRYTIGCSM